MYNIILSYNEINPLRLANIVEHSIEGAKCDWRPLWEGAYEFGVTLRDDAIDDLKEVLAPYV